MSHTLTHDSSGRVTRYDSASSDRYLGWNGRHLATTVTVGDSLADATPKAKDEFLYGPDGARYYKKSTWEVTDPATMTTSYPVEHTFYAGGHREVIRVGDTTNQSVATSSVTATVLHVRTTPVSGTPAATFEYLRIHRGCLHHEVVYRQGKRRIPLPGARLQDVGLQCLVSHQTALCQSAPHGGIRFELRGADRRSG